MEEFVQETFLPVSRQSLLKQKATGSQIQVDQLNVATDENERSLLMSIKSEQEENPNFLEGIEASDNEDIIIDEDDILMSVQDYLYESTSCSSDHDRKDNYTRSLMQTSNTLPIKPIVHKQSKLVQTKFTCNDSICGIIAAQDFTINCFYCYEEFSIRKCTSFIRHIERMHPNSVKKQNNANEDDNKSNAIPLGDKRLHPQSIETASSAITPLKLRKIAMHDFDVKLAEKLDQLTKGSSVNIKEENITFKKEFTPVPDLPSLIANDWSSNEDEYDNWEILDDTASLDTPLDCKTKQDELTDLPTLIANEWPSNEDPEDECSFKHEIKVEEETQETYESFGIDNGTHISPKNRDTVAEENAQEQPRETIVTTTIEPVLPNEDRKVTNANTSHRHTPFPARYIDSEDDMPSNDENEDDYPSSTNGCGILFGLTNRKIVYEFLQQLEKYPELYDFQESKTQAVLEKIRNSISELRIHMNEKFNISMNDVEVRLSIQRIYIWFNRTLRSLEKAEDMGKKFSATFPEYYKILERFLKDNIQKCNKNILWINNTGKKDHNDIWRYPRWMLYKESQKSRRSVRDANLADVELVFGDEDTQTESEDNHTHDDPPEPLLCDICYDDFQRRIDLRRHRIKHFPPQHSCHLCPRMHYTRLMAKQCKHADIPKKRIYKKEPHNEKSFVCKTCGAAYSSAGNLNFHIKDKHLKRRYPCGVCNYSSNILRYLRQHQSRCHTVEYGTCDEIARRTKPHHVSKVPYTSEERQEYLWLKEMRITKKTGKFFYGCFKCKLIFQTRQQKLQHNKQTHPITEKTLLCFLCRHDYALFSHVGSIRRHYIDQHSVPSDQIERYVKSTKTLIELLTPDEFNLVQTSDNKTMAISQILSTKTYVAKQRPPHTSTKAKATGEDILSDDDDDDVGMMYYPIVPYDEDDESNDDDINQSTLYRDFEIDLDENGQIYENDIHYQYQETNNEYLDQTTHGNQVFIGEIGNLMEGEQQIIIEDVAVDDINNMDNDLSQIIINYNNVDEDGY
ncbi:uncharacterized protein [Musca autumnalis]|uniref:uncharacterized protein n=1 Tax=Musca autumnalis TaxID=221902 RepID=UPI003CFA6430